MGGCTTSAPHGLLSGGLVPRQGWRPRRVREANDEGYAALHGGVPVWLDPSLAAWVVDALKRGESRWNSDSLRQVERVMRVSLQWSGQSPANNAGLDLITKARTDPEFFLDLADYCLEELGQVTRYNPYSLRKANALESMLQEAGSAWRVALDDEHHASLERRVDPTVTAAAERASGRPGQHLAEAWSSVYGRDPNPSHAYREAVRAVEAAAQPVVSQRNTRATLGTMIADLKNAPQNWQVVLTTPPGFDPVSALIGMMEFLWKAQIDRHGTPDTSVPLAVAQAEAEAAVHLAALLVQWFSGGAVTRR